MTDARRSDPTTTGGASDAALFKRYAANRDRRLRNELIERHRWVAAIAARRFRHRGENQDDLEQVALLGVLRRSSASILIAARRSAASPCPPCWGAPAALPRHHLGGARRLRGEGAVL
ncbi:MAG: hypothetical protein R2755_22355 [Acidimicrobiales bacterium]